MKAHLKLRSGLSTVQRSFFFIMASAGNCTSVEFVVECGRVFCFSKQSWLPTLCGTQVKQPSNRPFFISIMFVSMCLLSSLFH